MDLRRSCLVLVAVLLSAAPAAAQYSAVITACRWDAKGICVGAVPERGQLAACIEQNFQKLAEPCKAALVRIAAVRDACRADIQQQCPGTKVGAGRLLLCVKAHYTALSGPCRQAIGEAAAKSLNQAAGADRATSPLPAVATP
jgi:hypothetical protein